MLLLPLTPAQASFVEVEVLGRYLDDEDAMVAETIAIVAEHFERSRGTAFAVPNRELLRDLVLDVVNGIDDHLEEHRRGDSAALSRIGGVDAKQARGLFRAGQTLLKKLQTRT